MDVFDDRNLAWLAHALMVRGNMRIDDGKVVFDRIEVHESDSTKLIFEIARRYEDDQKRAREIAANDHEARLFVCDNVESFGNCALVVDRAVGVGDMGKLQRQGRRAS